MATPSNTNSSRRLALLIATSTYSDPSLKRLRSPGHDAGELTRVLRDPNIGAFEVEALINAGSSETQEKIEEFCVNAQLDDHLMIYLSCHGVLDGSGRLYYATTNTRRERLAATAVAAVWLNERLEDCRARRQIVLLDCCHSGAFARGAKGDDALALRQRFEPHGRGRVVLTASKSTEYSFEGNQVSGEGVRAAFTHAVVEGLRTGDADRDKDGLITVTDLYQHVYDKVRSTEPRQTPELWLYAAEGNLMIAQSVRGAIIEPGVLPEDLRVTLESPRPRVRETGVVELAELLDRADPSMALAAQQALQQVAAEDVPRVAAAARAALGAPHGTAADEVRQELAGLDRKEQQARRRAQEKARRQEEEKARRRAQEEEKARRHLEAEARRQASKRTTLTPTELPAQSNNGAASLSTLKGWRTSRPLFLLITVPTLIIVIFGCLHIVTSWRSVLAYQRVLQLTNLSSNVTALVQGLEDERDQTVYFISLPSGGRWSVMFAARNPPEQAAKAAGQQQLKSVVLQQQALTNQALAVVRSELSQIGPAFTPQTRQEAATALSELGQPLAALRHAATTTSLPPLVVVQKYTNLIDDLLVLEDTTVQGASDAQLARNVRVLGLISQMKQDASEQRAILASALLSGKLSPSASAALTTAHSDQLANTKQFLLSATASQLQLWNQSGAGAVAYQAPAAEGQAIAFQQSTGSLASDPTSADDWYGGMMYTINYQMGKVEQTQ